MLDKTFFETLLYIENPWEVSDVSMLPDESEIVISIEYTGTAAPCKECNRQLSIYDRRGGRKWRHLDMCQMRTMLCCSVPRVNCPDHGVKTISVPWADSSSRFTSHFESFAIELLSATKNQTKTSKLLRISFDSINTIMHKAVQRGLQRRDSDALIRTLGIDEKSFQRGHKYVTVVSDIDNRRVIDVCLNRTQNATKAILKSSLSTKQRDSVEAVCIDM